MARLSQRLRLSLKTMKTLCNGQVTDLPLSFTFTKCLGIRVVVRTSTLRIPTSFPASFGDVKGHFAWGTQGMNVASAILGAWLPSPQARHSVLVGHPVHDWEQGVSLPAIAVPV